MAEAIDYAGKTDPRIKRTRMHVIAVAREMLEEAKEPLSFTAVAERAFVARQTLYKHWGSIENLIAETIALPTAEASEYQGLDVQKRAAKFLTQITEQISGGTGAAIAAMFSASHYGPDAKAAVAKLNDSLLSSFNELVGKIDQDGFNEVVSPVIYLSLASLRPSKALLDSLSAKAVALVA